MVDTQSILDRIEALEARNTRVEAEKSWETSVLRRAVIALLTYLVFVAFFHVAELPRPFLNPIVPAAGFVLSTLSLSAIKSIWLTRR